MSHDDILLFFRHDNILMSKICHVFDMTTYITRSRCKMMRHGRRPNASFKLRVCEANSASTRNRTFLVRKVQERSRRELNPHLQKKDCRIFLEKPNSPGTWLSVANFLFAPYSPPPFAVGAILGTYSSHSLGAHYGSSPLIPKKKTAKAVFFFGDEGT